MKHDKIQLKTKSWCKKREPLFLFRKLTDISKQNTIFVKDVDAPTDCIGRRHIINGLLKRGCDAKSMYSVSFSVRLYIPWGKRGRNTRTGGWSELGDTGSPCCPFRPPLPFTGWGSMALAFMKTFFINWSEATRTANKWIGLIFTVSSSIK
jgi:hypothetical protein